MRETSWLLVPERFGRTPIFTSTWKPLQIPITSLPAGHEPRKGRSQAPAEEGCEHLAGSQVIPKRETAGKGEDAKRGKKVGLRDEIVHVNAAGLRAGQLEGKGKLFVGVDAVPGDDADRGPPAAHAPAPLCPAHAARTSSSDTEAASLPPSAILMPRSAVTSPSSPMDAPLIARSHFDAKRGRHAHEEPRRGLAEQRRARRPWPLLGRPGHRVQRDVRPAVAADAAFGERRPEARVRQVVARPHEAAAQSAVRASDSSAHASAVRTEGQGPRRAADLALHAGTAQLSSGFPDDVDEVPGDLEIGCLRLAHIRDDSHERHEERRADGDLPAADARVVFHRVLARDQRQEVRAAGSRQGRGTRGRAAPA